MFTEISKSTFNNILIFILNPLFLFSFIFKVFIFPSILTVSDVAGNVLFWSSSGSCGFKGSRKSTPFSAQVASETLLKRSLEIGIKFLEVNISGVGSGRETALRTLQNFRVVIAVIRDVTPLPHNGCRPKKIRRV